MYSQLAGTVSHIIWNTIFVNKLQLGVIGTGVAASLTNLVMFLFNVILTSFASDVQEATQISFTDSKVMSWSESKQQLRIGIPSFLTLFIDFTCYEITVLLSGYLSIDALATHTLLLNIFSLCYKIPIGF